MNDLTKFLVESITKDNNTAVIFCGDFQPMTISEYKQLTKLFETYGTENVYIGTNSKQNINTSPLSFLHKKKIFTELYGISSDKILNTDDTSNTILSEYTNVEIVRSENDSSYISVREKIRRLSTSNIIQENIFPNLNKKVIEEVKSYLLSVPELNEERVFIPKRFVENWILKNSGNINQFISEATVTNGATEADDGPIFLFPDYNTFNTISKKRAEAIGYELFRQIMSAELTDIDPHPKYPTGPVPAVSPYPAGVIGKLTATNQKDYKEDEAYTKWLFHVTRAMALTGYSLIGSLDIDMFDSFDYDEDDNTGSTLKGDTSRDLNEDIKIPVNIGDTILTGRFKNKKTVVKSIGTDEHGMPTINGKKVVTFRIPKETGTIFKNKK